MTSTSGRTPSSGASRAATAPTRPQRAASSPSSPAPGRARPAPRPTGRVSPSAAPGDGEPRKAKLTAIQQQISDEALALGFYASTYNLVGQKSLGGLSHSIFGPQFYEVRKN